MDNIAPDETATTQVPETETATTPAVELPKSVCDIFTYDTSKYTADSYRNQLYKLGFKFPVQYGIVVSETIDDLEDPPVVVPTYIIAIKQFPLITAIHKLLHTFPNHRITIPTSELLAELANLHAVIFKTTISSPAQYPLMYQIIPVFWTRKHAVCYVDYIYDAPDIRGAASHTDPDSKLFVYLKTDNIRAAISRICRNLYSKDKQTGDWSYPQDVENHRRSLYSVLTKFVIKK